MCALLFCCLLFFFLMHPNISGIATLQQIMSGWRFILLGFFPIGESNPLKEKSYVDLSLHQRMLILKTLCDDCLVSAYSIVLSLPKWLLRLLPKR